MRKLMLAVAAFAAVLGAEAAHSARLAVVQSTEQGKENVLVVSCLNGANETNSLWVATDSEDRGDTTNGWAAVTRLATMKPSDAYEYTLPAGWGTDVKAIRFFLSEVPYDVDYTIEYFAANDSRVRTKSPSKSQCIYIPDFKLNGDDRVETLVQLGFTTVGGISHAIFGTRGNNATTPYVQFFWINNTGRFRYDYYTMSSAKMNLGTIPYRDTTAKHYITASAEGVRIDDEWIKNQATPFTGPTASGLLLLTGTTSEVSNGGCENMYYFRVFDRDGNPRLDLVPAVKGGRVCAYDRLTDTPYYSYAGSTSFVELGAGPRVDPENPFFTSLVDNAPDPTDYHEPEGYVQDGGVRILSGQNDFGGIYTVSNQGVLAAAFGRGLGANDHLALTAGGAYGGWGGRMTATLGEGAGQISCLTANDRLAFVAAELRELVVNFGGAEPAQTVTINGEMQKFCFNGAIANGDVRVLNPFAVTSGTMDIQFNGRNVWLEGGVTGSAAAEDGINVALSTGDDAAEDATLTFCGTTNSFRSFQVYGGRCVCAPGTKFTLGGNAYVYGGTLVLTNAILDLTGRAGYMTMLSSQPVDGGGNGGTIDIQGGEITASVLGIGENGATQSPDCKVRIAGKVRLKPISTGNGNIAINTTAASDALTLEDGADVQAVALVHRQCNVYHNGGLLGLSGSLQMAANATARYTLGDGAAGAVLRTPVITRVASGSYAYFVFNGGKLVNTAEASTDFFGNFNSTSHVQINPAGGEFETDQDVAISQKLGKYESSETWDYTSKDYLTAPAFRKSGSGTLTLTGGGTADYRSATEVAEGVLALAEGGVVALPSATVVRLSGGTFDLGGNAQTVKALCGTAGTVRNGTLTVSEAIFPGGDGTVGSFTCSAALAGKLSIDVEADGSADQIVTTTSLDVSNLDLVLNLPDDVSQITRPLVIVKGPVTGTFKSVPATLPKGWEIRCRASGVRLGPPTGLLLIIK